MPLKTTQARVIHTTALTKHLLHVILEPESYITYEAGQYLQIISPTTQALNYSIANAPNTTYTYELHIRHSRDTRNNKQLLRDIAQQNPLTLRLPLGQCTLRAINPIKPILFIAGGTGFAPIKAMIEQLIIENQTRPVILYWNARSTHDLYMHAQAQVWSDQIPWFTYYSRLSHENKESIHTLILNHPIGSLHDWQIVLAGPFDMVYTLRDELLTYGMPMDQLYSDAFAFETTNP